ALRVDEPGVTVDAAPHPRPRRLRRACGPRIDHDRAAKAEPDPGLRSAERSDLIAHHAGSGSRAQNGRAAGAYRLEEPREIGSAADHPGATGRIRLRVER